MPGLFGILSNQRPITFADLLPMANALKPAIPGISEAWLDDSGRLGWGREVLAYILPNGQPLRVGKETWLMADGETADCRDPQRANEFLAKTYHEGGCEALGHLNGGVCAAVWERDVQRLSLVTDFLGLRPLFYLQQPGRLAFASEIKALLALGWIQPSINEEALAEWLAFEVLDGDRTLFKDIKRLPPGSVLIWEGEQTKVYPYVHLGYSEELLRWSESQWVEAFIETLGQSLQRRLVNPQGYVLPLSGGLDSRLLLGLISTRLQQVLPLVTYGEPSSRDVKRAKEMGKTLGYPHQILFLDEEYPKKFARACIERSEGYLNVVDSHGWTLNSLPSSCQVLVLGNGADLFLNTADASYSSEVRAISDPFEAYIAYINDLFKFSEWLHWFTPGFVNRYRDLPRQRIEEEVAQTPGASLSLKLDTHCLFFYEVDYILHGLSVVRPRFEYTEPYLDRDLVMLMLSLPPNLRAKRYLEKKALSHVNPQLARIKGGPLTQPSSLEVLYDRLERRLKWGFRRLNVLRDAHLEPPSSTFSNMHHLLRLKPNRQWVEDTLLKSPFLERGWFRPQAVRQAIDEHMQGIRNHTRHLGAMITIEMVAQRFVDKG